MKLFYSDVFELPLPAGHRFPMAKYRLLRERVDRELTARGAELQLPPAATDRQILQVHTREYLDKIKYGGLSKLEQRRIGFPWSLKMVERSRRSTGATIAAAQTAIAEGISINMAGGTHHAFADRGQGFCVFNDVCVAAKFIQQQFDVNRIMVVDCDVHQGNGTAAISRDDPTVFALSIQCETNFPFQKTAGDLDVNLPAGTSDSHYLSAMRQAVEQSIETFQPEFVFYLAGADPFAGDRLGQLELTKLGLCQRDEWIFSTFQQRNIPVAVSMAGGYANDIEDIVDIHFATIDQALKRHGSTDQVANGVSG